MNTKSHYRVYKSPPELLYNVSGHRGLYVNIWKVEKLCNFSSLVDLSNKSMTKNCNLGYVRTVTYFEVSSMLIVTVPPPFLKKNNICTNFPNLFCQETLHISGSSSTHRQEVSTVHSTLVYVMQV